MEDFNLTDHFTFFELTRTANSELQEANREAALEVQDKLSSLAELLEVIRAGVGCPVNIHSGYRSPALNAATAGSSSTSQHALGEAADFSCRGWDIDALFEKVQEVLESQGCGFGQLIRENAQRGYGASGWIHVSLGEPYRDSSKCGQVMTMEDGTYALVRTIGGSGDTVA